MSDISRDRLIDLTGALVRLPSVLGEEQAVAERVHEEMRRLGYDQVNLDEVGNCVGVVKGDREGPTLLLDAHMDTVDVLPREAWSGDPFSGRAEGGRIHGRGSSDMKGALAAMILAAGGLDRSRLVGQVVVSASVNEELIEGAALRQVMERHPPDFVVIGEASELNLVRAGRGRAELVVESRGRPSHASTPDQGLNAIHEMRAAIEQIEALEMPSHPFVGHGVMCLTDIISLPYPAHSVVPSGCRATYERRLVPGETRQRLLAEVGEACRRAGTTASVELARAEVTTWTGHGWSEEKWYPPWELEEEHPLVQKALAGLRKSGLAPRLSSYQFCTNAAYSAGVAGVPTIGFGPSRESLAHVVDEYLEVEELEAAYRGYSALILALVT